MSVNCAHSIRLLCKRWLVTVLTVVYGAYRGRLLCRLAVYSTDTVFSLWLRCRRSRRGTRRPRVRSAPTATKNAVVLCSQFLHCMKLRRYRRPSVVSGWRVSHWLRHLVVLCRPRLYCAIYCADTLRSQCCLALVAHARWPSTTNVIPTVSLNDNCQHLNLFYEILCFENVFKVNAYWRQSQITAVAWSLFRHCLNVCEYLKVHYCTKET